MNDDINKKIEEIRNTIPRKIAEDLCSVQPMPEHIDLNALAEALDMLRAANGHRCVYDPLHKHAKQEQDKG